MDEDEVEKMSRRFVHGVKDFWGKKRLEDIEEMGTRGFEGCERLNNMMCAC